MEKLQISTRLTVFLIFVCFVPLLFLFFYVNYDNILNSKSSKEVFLESRSKDECIGKVDSIYRQKMNHNILTLKTSDCIFQVDADWEAKFMVGDSISKKKGELIVKYYRNGKLIEVLDYRDIAKTMK
jgi:precorrin-3B methylase